MSKRSARPVTAVEVEETTAIDVEIEGQEEAEHSSRPPLNEAPQSAPEAAGAIPASMRTEPSALPRVSTRQVFEASECPFPLPNDPKTLFPNLSEEKAKALTTMVKVQVMKDMEGCRGVNCRFQLKAKDRVLLPRWFAESYPKHLLVKE